MKIKAKHSNKYLSIADDLYTIIQDSKADDWFFDKVDHKYGYIVSTSNPNRCIQTNDIKMKDHIQIHLGIKQSGNYSQLWEFKIVDGKENIFYIINKTKRKEGNIENICLDVPEGKVDDKLNIIAYHVKSPDTTSPENQWWEMS
jgi:hypothetical protein